MRAIAREDQDAKNPGVNAQYANIVHNDLNDNSGRMCCAAASCSPGTWVELRARAALHGGRGRQEDVAAVHARLTYKPMETVEQFLFVLCAWPSFADQPYITNYRIYDDRVGETTRFIYRPDHEWYWFAQQKPTEVSMLKCHDSRDRRLRLALVFPLLLVSTRPRRPTPDAARTSRSGPLSSSSSGARLAGQRHRRVAAARTSRIVTRRPRHRPPRPPAAHR